MSELAPLAYIAVMAALIGFLVVRADQQTRYYRKHEDAANKEMRRELLALIPGERRSAYEVMTATETQAETSRIRANKPPREKKPDEDGPMVLDGRSIPQPPPGMVAEPDWKQQMSQVQDGIPGDNTGLN